jgi:hypothetical protein
MIAIAFMWAYNEADIIGHVIHHLQHEGVGVNLFNNWSTDATEKIAMAEGSMWHVERWPIYGPEPVVSWQRMLDHTAHTAFQYAQTRGAFWALHHDADEIRRSPVDGETLYEFFRRVRMAGWNAVDHRVETYAPRDGYDPLVHHPETYFTERLADHIDNHNGQLKAWWQTPDLLVDLAGTGGHKVTFPGRKVCPEKLILRHYPMRGAEQRAAKARSRNERWAPEDRAKGMHEQYQT